MIEKVKLLIQHQSGFSLIELLVVIALVGVLAATSLTLLNPLKQFQKSRDTKRKADIAQIQAAFELYRSDQGSYPSNPIPACSSALSAGSTTYLKSMPCDPSTATQYTYTPSGSPATSYSLKACLENASDPQKDASNTCTGGKYSYTVTNP